MGDNADYFPDDPTRWEQPASDTFLEYAEPFIEKLVFDDSQLQAYADAIVSGGGSSSRECQVNALYRDVLLNYTCIPAPLDASSLQTPQETIQRKQGTCEDLSILLCSLFMNSGMSSQLVFTSTHVYAIVLDVNTDTLWDVVEQSLINQTEKTFGEPVLQEYNQTYNLSVNAVLYAGGEEGKTFAGVIDSMTIDYSIQSDRQLMFFVVPSWAAYYAFQTGDFANFTYSNQWNATTITGTVPQLGTYGGLMVYNAGTQKATASMDLVFSFQPSFYQTYNKNALTVYSLGGRDAVLCDPRLGVYGFPGYDAGIVGEKKVINPVTKQYVIFP